MEVVKIQLGTQEVYPVNETLFFILDDKNVLHLFSQEKIVKTYSMTDSLKFSTIKGVVQDLPDKPLLLINNGNFYTRTKIYLLSSIYPYKIEEKNFSCNAVSDTFFGLLPDCIYSFSLANLTIYPFSGSVKIFPLSSYSNSKSRRVENISNYPCLFREDEPWMFFNGALKRVKLLDLRKPLPLSVQGKDCYFFVNDSVETVLCCRIWRVETDSVNGIVKRRTWFQGELSAQEITWTSLIKPDPPVGSRNRRMRKNAGVRKSCYNLFVKCLQQDGSKYSNVELMFDHGLFDAEVYVQMEELRVLVRQTVQQFLLVAPLPYGKEEKLEKILSAWSTKEVHLFLRHVYYRPPDGPGYLKAVEDNLK